MANDAITYALIRMLEDRAGIRVTPEFVNAHGDISGTDREQSYIALYNRFLCTDLVNSSIPVIPESFSQESLSIFPPGHLRRGGGVVLQIHDTLNISVSSVSLLNALANVGSDRQVYEQRTHDQDISLPRGMLTWTLTDGFHKIQALEFKRIEKLDLTTPFGYKILVKSCQVRRNMLLLEPTNVELLGGDVPTLYNFNMRKELEKRLKIRLGLIPSTIPPPEAMAAVQAPTEQFNAMTIANDTIQDFDSDDFDDLDDTIFQTLDDRQLDATSHLGTDTLPSAEKPDLYDSDVTMEEPEPEPIAEFFDERLIEPTYEPDLEFDDSSSVGLVEDPLADVAINDGEDWTDDDFHTAIMEDSDTGQQDTQPESDTSCTITEGASLNTLDDQMTLTDIVESTAVGSPHNTSHTIITPSQSLTSLPQLTQTSQSQTLVHSQPNTPHPLANISGSDSMSDMPVTNGDPNDPNGTEITRVAHVTVTEVCKILRDMANNDYSTFIADQLVVETKVRQLGRLNLSANEGFYLTASLENPDSSDSDDLLVVLRSEVVEELLGKTPRQVIDMNKERGAQAVATEVFKPFTTWLQSTKAVIELDLSLVEHHENGTLMPVVVSYRVI